MGGGVFQGEGNICDTLGSVHSVAAAASLQPQHACQQEHVFHVTNRQIDGQCHCIKSPVLWWRSYEMVKNMRICLLVSSQYTKVMERQTDRHQTMAQAAVTWQKLGMCRIDFLNFGSIQSEFQFGSKKQFCSNIIVIYYSCNSWVVNLQQILQRQSSHDFDITDNNDKKVSNVIPF